MAELSTEELAELEARLLEENAKAEAAKRSKALSGSADATVFGGPGPQTINNPYTGGATPGPLTGLKAPLLGSREEQVGQQQLRVGERPTLGQGSREARVDPASGQPSMMPAGYANQVNTGDGNAESARIAKQMLDRGEFSGAEHKKRLEQIVETSGDTQLAKTRAAVGENAAELKHQQELADTGWKALVAAGSDANNPMTIAEFDQAAAEFQRNNLARTMPNPTQIRKRLEEKDNPAVQVANQAKSMMQHYPGLSEDQLSGLFAHPKKGENITRQDIESAHRMARQLTGTEVDITSAKSLLSRADAKMKAFDERNPGFDKTTPELVKADGSWYIPGDSVSPEQVNARRTLNAEYKGIIAEQQKYEGKLRHAAGEGGAAPPPANKDLPTTQPPPAGSGITPPPAVPQPGSSYDLAIEATATSFADDVAEAKRTSAAHNNSVVYVKSTNGSVYPITAKK